MLLPLPAWVFGFIILQKKAMNKLFYILPFIINVQVFALLHPTVGV
jgi:hypothetical protein